MKQRCTCLSLLIAIAALICPPFACSPISRQKLAEFFFEIPQTHPSTQPADLQPSQMSVSPGRAVASGTPFVSIHEPVARRRCSACHDAGADQAIAKPWDKKCAGCHQEIVRPRPFMHGPVGAMACNECHVPHASALPSLLRQTDPALCVSCHSTTLKQEPPYHDNPSLGCATCHDPHGSNNRNLLKPRDQWEDRVLTTATASSPADGEDR